MAITDTDYITISATKYYIFSTDIRTTASNEYISFVQPLTANPSSSTFNLSMVTTQIKVSGYMDPTKLGSPNDFSGLHAGMLLSSVSFTHGGQTMTVIIKNIDVSEPVNQFWCIDPSNSTKTQFKKVDITLEKCTPL